MKRVDKSESPNQRYRNGDRRNDGRTPIQQEEEDHNNDNDHRFFERSDNLFHRIANHRGCVEGDHVLDAGRKRLRKLDERRLGRFVDLQRIGSRELLHTDADGFVPTVQEVRVIAFRADFRAPNIFELHDPLARVLDDDAFEFLRLGEPSHYAQRHLKFLLRIGGRAAQLSRGYFDVLLLQSGDYVGGGKLSCSQLCRVEPYAHGILAFAEDDDVADPRNPLQGILDVDVQVVGDVLVRKAVIGRVESRGKTEVGICLGDGHACVLDFLWQAALGRRYPVLHVDRGNVQVISGAEGYVDVAGAVVRTCGGDVVHPLDAVNLLLQRNRNGGFDYLRVRADVVAGDGDLRWRQVRIQRNRQTGDGNRPRQNNQQGADRRKNWPLNEEINQMYTSFVLPELSGLADRLNGRSVNQELGAGDDHFFPGLQTAVDGIVVAYGIAESYCTLLGNAPVLSLSRHVNKCLPSNACHRQHWNRWRRSGAPHDPRLDQLRIPELVERVMERRLHQYSLERVVHLLGNEIDLCG